MTDFAWDRVHRRGRALHHRVRGMAAGANRGDRISLGDESGVNAVLPLVELVAVASGADLCSHDRKAALAGDRDVRGGMFGRIDVGMAASAPECAVNRFSECVAGDMQGEHFAVGEWLLHPFGLMACQTLQVGLGKTAR